MDEEAVKSIILSLPSSAVAYLMSISVCPRCIFRIFGIVEDVYSSNLCSFINLWPLVSHSSNENEGVQQKGSGNGLIEEHQDREETCIACLGILQMLCYDEDKGINTGNIFDFASNIMKTVKDEGHQFNNFCLEVSVPPIIFVREHAIRLHIKEKYKNEIWFEKFTFVDQLSVKDALKLSLSKTLESILGYSACSNSSFRIVLIFKHNETSSELGFVCNSNDLNAKRKRPVECKEMQREVLSAIEIERAISKGETSAAILRSLSSIPDDEFIKKYQCPPKNVSTVSQFKCMCYRTSIYIGGRYLKYSRNISQTCWMIDDERMGKASVEEIIGNAILPYFRGDRYKFHAAGREDIDVRMLGSGRPFLVEVQNAQIIPSHVDIIELQKKINQSEDASVEVKELKQVGSEAWDLMREGEAEKQKEYAAVVWVSRTVSEDDLKFLSGMTELEIDQKTPVRVLHRRSPLVRKRLIYWMKAEKIEGSKDYFMLRLCTQAGTYIKEFVHGDLGRTHPSIGSLLGCVAEILQLDVTDVKMDIF